MRIFWTLPIFLAVPAFAPALAPALAHADEIRFATYNASLNRDAPGALTQALQGDDPQIAAIAATLAEIDADVLLINEFDYAPENATLFRDRYLGGLGYDHLFIAPSNTGIASGHDLNGDGEIGTESFAYANDAFGFGLFEGQYGMLVLSRHPIDSAAIRTFQTFRWIDMPDARLPQIDGESFYAPEALEDFRLSSKSHWDVPIAIDGQIVHFLVSHPTPPVFDGPEDRNGRRNADEIRFWADYVQGADYIYDDAGVTGGLPEGASFVIAGDLNADPYDGDGMQAAIAGLLALGNTSVTPSSPGAEAAAEAQGGPNDSHLGPARYDTADFSEDRGPGNLRVDYVLPSPDLTVSDAGVYWPTEGAGAERITASDHRPVWIDLSLQ